jgi:topoisomerase-4 subunit A
VGQGLPFAQLNEMACGKGTRLQRYKDGGLSDAKVFAIAPVSPGATRPGAHSPSPGLSSRTRPELKEWIGNRAEAGRLPPRGIPEDQSLRGLTAKRSSRPLAARLAFVHETENKTAARAY